MDLGFRGYSLNRGQVPGEVRNEPGQVKGNIEKVVPLGLKIVMV